jgi:hypothetical protein
MRVVRFSGENVSPSDDGRLYDQIFENGLFEATTIAPAGGSQINIGPLYGIIRGREFTAEAQTIDATLPTGSGTATGTIYAEIDLSKEEPLSIKTALDPWTATDQNINVSGVVAQVKIGTYTANPTAVAAASYVAPSTPVSPLDKYEELKQKDMSLTNGINALVNRMNTAEENINTNRSNIANINTHIANTDSRVSTLESQATYFANIGQFVYASGQYITAQWTFGTNSCVLHLPNKGRWLVFGRFEMSEGSATYRNSYKQFQIQARTTNKAAVKIQNPLYYDAASSNSSNYMLTRIVQQIVDVSVVDAEIQPYVHTDTANLTYNVVLYGILIQPWR